MEHAQFPGEPSWNWPLNGAVSNTLDLRFDTGEGPNEPQSVPSFMEYYGVTANGNPIPIPVAQVRACACVDVILHLFTTVCALGGVCGDAAADTC